MLTILVYWVENINIVKKSTEVLSLEGSRDGSVEETKYMVIFRHQNAGQNKKLKYFGNVGKVQLFGSNCNESKLH
jgi:hypothetical protein